MSPLQDATSFSSLAFITLPLVALFFFFFSLAHRSSHNLKIWFLLFTCFIYWYGLWGCFFKKCVVGRMDMCICMAEPLCCPPETITTLLVSYIPIQNKKLKKLIKIVFSDLGKMLVCNSVPILTLLGGCDLSGCSWDWCPRFLGPFYLDWSTRLVKLHWGVGLVFSHIKEVIIPTLIPA